MLCIGTYLGAAGHYDHNIIILDSNMYLYYLTKLQLHHNQSLVDGYDSQTQTQTSEHSNASEVLIAPISPAAVPLSSFNSMEMSDLGPTPSTCTVRVGG